MLHANSTTRYWLHDYLGRCTFVACNCRLITTTFGITAFALRDIGLRDAEDPEILEAAKTQEVIMLTKDSDFVDLANRFGAPPQIIWLTCGNTSNARLKEILNATLLEALEILCSDEILVEISGN